MKKVLDNIISWMYNYKRGWIHFGMFKGRLWHADGSSGEENERGTIAEAGKIGSLSLSLSFFMAESTAGRTVKLNMEGKRGEHLSPQSNFIRSKFFLIYQFFYCVRAYYLLLLNNVHPSLRGV